MEIQRYLTPLGVICVIIVLTSELVVSTKPERAELQKESKFDDIIHSFNIVVTAYGFLINLYPIYDSIEPSKRNHRTILLACMVGLGFGAIVYLAFSAMSAEVFGL